mgnify:CR=1 FL=1
MEKVLGRDISNAAEIRRRQQQGVQAPNIKDAEVDALPEASAEASVMPLNPINDVICSNRTFSTIRSDYGRSRGNTFTISTRRRTES